MKKKYFIVLCVIAINIIALSSFKALQTIVAPEVVWNHITVLACDCEGDPDLSLECQEGRCDELGTKWACVDWIPCGEPFYPPPE